MAKLKCGVCGQAFPSRPALRKHQLKAGHAPNPKGKAQARGRPVALWAGLGAVALVLAVGAWFLLAGPGRTSGESAGAGGSGGGDLPPAHVGQPAPDFSFTTVDGRTFQLSDFRGQPVMFWLLATWCPTCQVSAQALAERIDEIERLGLVIVTLKLHNNLGYPGPTIEEFGRRWASEAFNSPNWLWGDASQAVSFSYDPRGVPDIYWLIDPQGIVRARDTAPNTTLNRILEFARSSR